MASEADIASQLDVCGTPIITNFGTSGILPTSVQPVSLRKNEPSPRERALPMRGECSLIWGLSYFIRLGFTLLSPR